jgi:hypothetical protein
VGEGECDGGEVTTQAESCCLGKGSQRTKREEGEGKVMKTTEAGPPSETFVPVYHPSFPSCHPSFPIFHPSKARSLQKES